MGTILLRDAVVVTMNPGRDVLERASVLIRDQRIAAVGDASEIGGDADEVIDCRKRVVLPGMVDLHGYLGGSVLRSVVDGQPAKERRELLERMISHFIDIEYWGVDAELGAVERLRCGTTFMFSMLGGNGTRTDHKGYTHVAAAALEKIGLRSRIGVGPARPPWPRPYTLWEDGSPRETSVTFDEVIDTCDALLSEWRAGPKGLVDYCVALSRFGNRNEHDPVWSPDKEIWVGRQAEASRHLMEKHDVGFWTHAYGNAVEYAHDEKLGLLGPRSILSHCTDINERAIGILRDTGTSVAHHPRAARIYTAPGRCPLPELLDAGVNVGLGADAPSNHDCDIFLDMKAAIMAQRMHFKDPKLLPPGVTLAMATINGYKALGLDDALGSIEVGKLADLIVVDMNQPHLAPFDMPVHRLVHHASGRDVSHVLVDGRVVLRDGRFPHVDVPDLIARSEDMYARLLDRSGLQRSMTR
ncbi:MAG: amidohydrolase family protein [Microvirga sp.]|nr:amidohydrolase family protein [Microvirga sp.]